MQDVKYNQIKKDFPQKAEEILQEQETIVLFLNSPVRKNWMIILKLDGREQQSINKVVERYAKIKVNQEKKLKLKSKDDIVKIEDKALREVFEARIVKISHVKDKIEAAHIAENLAKEEFPKGVVFDTIKLDKLTTLAGANSTKITPVDIVVFDPKSKKIISYEIVIEKDQ